MHPFSWLEAAFVSGAAFNKVRTYVIVAVFLLMGVQYLRQKKPILKPFCKSTKAHTEKVDQYFQKDENGDYPWEKDVNDHPSRIPPNSKRITDTWSKKRGRW